MTVKIINAPVVLKERITELCRETNEAHRTASPRDWPDNFFDLFVLPGIQAAFTDRTGRRVSESPSLFVAMDGDTLAGYYRLSGFPIDPKQDYFSVELQDIYVLPKYRRQGIGSAMVAHAMAAYEKHDWDKLEASIADWNEGSRALFEAAGFTTYSRKLAIGPVRQARPVPLERTVTDRLETAWPKIVLVILGLGFLLAFLSR